MLAGKILRVTELELLDGMTKVILRGSNVMELEIRVGREQGQKLNLGDQFVLTLDRHTP